MTAEYRSTEVALGGRRQIVHRPTISKPVSLRETDLIAAARRRTGLHFFGDENFRPALRHLLASIGTEADLNEFGEVMAYQDIVNRLANRLRAQDLFDRHPEILTRRVGPLFVVMGLMRSGTTLLHRLLACDARFLHLKGWEVHFPVPSPDCFGAQPDPRHEKAWVRYRGTQDTNPENLAIHTQNPDDPEEEIGLLNESFAGIMQESMRWVPSYGTWNFTASQHGAYRWMRQLLQLISWYRGDPEGRPWILKSPTHMQDLDALMDVFPDTRLVFLHRDPAKVIPSGCSMWWNLHVVGQDAPDPTKIGRAVLERSNAQLLKVEGERASMVPENAQLDVNYADLRNDWRPVVERIYRHFDVGYTAALRRRMEDWAASDHHDAARPHRYALSDFGLTDTLIDQRLGWYRDLYTIPRE